MFVRYYVEVPLPTAQVEVSLLASQPGWLSAVAGAAQARGDGLLGEVGVGRPGGPAGRQVRIRLGEPMRFPSMTSVPLTWEPVGLEGVLPRLDANLELGVVGQALDRVLLHRVAEPPSRTSSTGSARPSP
jgi:hypothetical protein